MSITDHELVSDLWSGMRALFFPSFTISFGNYFSDVDISSADSGLGADANVPTPPTMPEVPSMLAEDMDLRTSMLTATPIHFKMYDLNPSDSTKESKSSSYRASATNISPIINWIPNWDEYGSYILSPQNISTQRNILGVSGGCLPENQEGCEVQCRYEDDDMSPHLSADFSLLAEDGSPSSFCSNVSDSGSCEFEIIAEYTQSDHVPSNFQLE